jgi:hypothetical protein
MPSTSSEKRCLSRSSIDNYLKPLQGTLALALKRGLIATSPWALLDKDDRPQHIDKPPHE